MKKKLKKDRFRAFRISEELDDQIVAQAEEEGIVYSELVRKMINEYLKNEGYLQSEG